MTLDTISLSTCEVTTDGNWVEKFVSRSDQTTAVHKLGRMENLGIYWNTESQQLEKLRATDWEIAMKSMIYVTPRNVMITGKSQLAPLTGSPSTPRQSSLVYILPPPNNLIVKIIHADRPTDTIAAIELIIESKNLSVNLDKLQYEQLMSTVRMLGQLARQKQMALYRPRSRPTVDPRGWWKYAFSLVSGRDLSVSSKVR